MLSRPCVFCAPNIGVGLGCFLKCENYRQKSVLRRRMCLVKIEQRGPVAITTALLYDDPYVYEDVYSLFSYLKLYRVDFFG